MTLINDDKWVPPIEAGEQELRTATVMDAEARANVQDEEGNEGIPFKGRAAVFRSESQDLGGFREEIKPGAFRKALRDRNQDVKFYGINHNPDSILARSGIPEGKLGHLGLRESTRGLEVDSLWVPTPRALELRQLILADVINQMSYGFRVAKNGDVWEEKEDANGNLYLKRTIKEFERLIDVSPVGSPAYLDTTASVRSMTLFGVQLRDVEGAVNAEELRGLAWRIHRGDVEASHEQRHAIEALFEALEDPSVAPWTAARALRAVSQEPELLDAVQGFRAQVALESIAGPVGESGDEFRHEAAARERARQLAELMAG